MPQPLHISVAILIVPLIITLFLFQLKHKYSTNMPKQEDYLILKMIIFLIKRVFLEILITNN